MLFSVVLVYTMLPVGFSHVDPSHPLSPVFNIFRPISRALQPILSPPLYINDRDPCFAAQVCKQPDPKAIFVEMYETSRGAVSDYWNPCKITQSGSDNPDVYVPDLCSSNVTSASAVQERFFKCMAEKGISKGQWLGNIPQAACLPLDRSHPCLAENICKQRNPSVIFQNILAGVKDLPLRDDWIACHHEAFGTQSSEDITKEVCFGNSTSAAEHFNSCMSTKGHSRTRLLAAVPKLTCLPVLDNEPCLITTVCQHLHPGAIFARQYASTYAGPVRDFWLECREAATGSMDKRNAVRTFCSPDPTIADEAINKYFKCYAQRGVSQQAWLAAISKRACLPNSLV